MGSKALIESMKSYRSSDDLCGAVQRRPENTPSTQVCAQPETICYLMKTNLDRSDHGKYKEGHFEHQRLLMV